MMNEPKRCDTCIHAKVCKYIDEFQRASKALRTAEMVSEPAPGVYEKKRVNALDYVRVPLLDCNFYRTDLEAE